MGLFCCNRNLGNLKKKSKKNILKIVFGKRRLDKAIKSKGCQSPFSPCCHPGAALTALLTDSHWARFDFFFSFSPTQHGPRAGWGVQGLESPHLAAAPRSPALGWEAQPEQLEADPTKSSFLHMQRASQRPALLTQLFSTLTWAAISSCAGRAEDVNYFLIYCSKFRMHWN